MSDPTRTQTLRKQYAQKLRGAFAEINAAARRGIVENDIFGLQANVSDPPHSSQSSSDEQVRRFMNWLEQQEERGILEVIDRDDNTFVRSAYSKGVRHADAALAQQGIEIPDEDLSALFNRPTHRDTLQSLYTTNYNDLRGITSDMNTQISRELTQGFARGLGSAAIASNISDSVSTIGKNRATTLAHTQVINAHAESTLNRFEEFGVDEVTVDAEVLTAGDERVCPICSSLEGETMTVEEARQGEMTHDGHTHRSHPPFHARCRCALLPVVT